MKTLDDPSGSLSPGAIPHGSTDKSVLQLARGFQVSAAIYAAVRLEIPDLISDAPRTSAELAAATGTFGPALSRLLRTLAAYGLVSEVGSGSFVLHEAGAALRAGHPQSIRPMVLFLGSQNVWETWGMLVDCVKTGAPATALLTGAPDPNAYRDRHPEAAALFHDAMTARVKPIAEALATAYDFSSVDSIVDIGGGHGQLVISLLLKYPRLRGVVFDLPAVVDGAREACAMAGVADRCDTDGGSMFDRVPPGADLYLMSSIIHDWPDAKVVEVLQKTSDAMTDQARLLVIDHLLPQPGEASADAQAQVLDDLTMLVRTGGRGRRESELRELFTNAGLQVTRVAPLGFARRIVEGMHIA
jgi:orsellinic acid C2-O-methyltransferase